MALALAAALGYGVSDFVGGLASRHVAALRVVIVSYPVAVVFLLVLAVFTGGTITGPAVFWGVSAGLAGAFGVWWFYAALGSGPISVVSPVTAVLVAGIPLVVGLALGERPGMVAGVGAVVAIAAVALVSREGDVDDDRPHRFTKKVALLTVGAGAAFACNFVLLHQVPHEANLWPLVFGRAVASVLVFAIALASGNLRVPHGTPLKLAFLAAALDTVANVTTLLALQASMLSLASVLISLYPAATVALAMVVLRERVTRWQVAGMILALAAILMLASA